MPSVSPSRPNRSTTQCPSSPRLPSLSPPWKLDCSFPQYVRSYVSLTSVPCGFSVDLTFSGISLDLIWIRSSALSLVRTRRASANEPSASFSNFTEPKVALIIGTTTSPSHLSARASAGYRDFPGSVPRMRGAIRFWRRRRRARCACVGVRRDCEI